MLTTADKIAKIIKGDITQHHSDTQPDSGDVVVGNITFLWFLQFLIGRRCPLALCVNCSVYIYCQYNIFIETQRIYSAIVVYYIRGLISVL